MGKLFENWEQDVLRPIVINLATALLLFLAALGFTPIRSFLFPPDGLRDYPIYCVAEPYRNALDPSKLNVDLFVINRTDKDYTVDDLATILATRFPGKNPPASPTIYLHYTREALGQKIGAVETVTYDADFNEDKGLIVPEIVGNDVRIRIDHIKKRAVAKVTIVVAGLPNLEGNAPVLRTAKSLVPFDIEKYQIACHDR